jgi:5-(carboxyamino)imidazole ribonucleotide synthase
MKVGILGAGQLGRMLALEGYPLGLQFRFFDRTSAPSAGNLGDVVTADFSDFDALARFADGLDVVTYEFENVPVAAAEFLADRLPVYPTPRALAVAQDRWEEKKFFQALGIATADTESVDSRDELDAALRRIGIPAVLKTRRLGYDGKGQFVIRAESSIDAAWAELGAVPLVLEAFVPFDRELSIIGARGRDGVIRCYPLTENTHDGGILRTSRAPAPGLSDTATRQAERALTAALTTLGYVGVMAIEFFEQNGELLANEMAPRVHNSGHWTIEGAWTSQFENHLRAVTGLPLGAAAAIGHSIMVNLIGKVPDPSRILAVDCAHLHLYGKSGRAGRKVGHVTLWSETPEALDRRLAELLTVLSP